MKEEEIEAFLEEFPEFKKTLEELFEMIAKILKPIIDVMMPLINILMEFGKNIFDKFPEEFKEYLLNKIKEEYNDGRKKR